MKIQLVIQMVLLLGANYALAAMPVVNLNQAVQESEPAKCQRTSQENDFRKLIVKASVIDGDDRKVMSKNLKVVGFSDAEQEQAMRCTGHIFCPGANGGNGTTFSAGAICPRNQRASNGFCAADRLGTVAHGFVEKDSLRMIPQLEKCEFQNYRGHKSKLTVKDLKSINPTAEGQNPHANPRADKLVVRLQKPIPGCDPYELDENPVSPGPGTKVVALTHKQADQTMAESDGMEPLAYVCYITRTFAPKNGSAGATYSNCDVNKGGSGGFVLVRNSDNRLAVTGLFSSAGDESQNGQPYYEPQDSKDLPKRTYTVASSTNADFVQMAATPGIPPEFQITQGVRQGKLPTGN